MPASMLGFLVMIAPGEICPMLTLIFKKMMIILVNRRRVVEPTTPSRSPRPPTTPGQILPYPLPAARSTSDEADRQDASSNCLA